MDVDYFDYDHYEGLEADGGDNMYGETFLDFVHNYYNIFDGRLMVLLKHNLIYAWESCIVYTIIEIFKNYIWKLVLWNFLFRIVSSTSKILNYCPNTGYLVYCLFVFRFIDQQCQAFFYYILWHRISMAFIGYKICDLLIVFHWIRTIYYENCRFSCHSLKFYK